MARKIDVRKGDVYNKLTIVKELAHYKSKTCGPRGYSEHRMFKCECECGKTINVILQSLRNGNTKSCGCLRSQVNIAKNIASTGTKKNKYNKKNKEYWDHWKVRNK